MVCLRCELCGACWIDAKAADASDYDPCPECGADVYETSTSEPMPPDEAHTRMTHAKFERWLDEHDRRGPVEQLDRAVAVD